MYRKITKQQLPINKERAWDFLSNPQNLKIITPPYMRFEILFEEETAMYPGQIIQYIVTPILGIKLNWITEISQVVEGKFFIDEQRFGPFRFWHHKHFIYEIENGVEMVDIIDYILPLGFIGKLVHPFLVQPNMDKIFTYRRNKLEKLFGKYNV